MGISTAQTGGEVYHLRKWLDFNLRRPCDMYYGPWDSGNTEIGFTNAGCNTVEKLGSYLVDVGTEAQPLFAISGMPTTFFSLQLQKGTSNTNLIQNLKFEIWAGAAGSVSRVVVGSTAPGVGKPMTGFNGLLCQVNGLMAQWWEVRAIMDSAAGATDPVIFTPRVLIDRLGGVGASGAGAKPAVMADANLSAVTLVLA
jgi:hypothetical protein